MTEHPLAVSERVLRVRVEIHFAHCNTQHHHEPRRHERQDSSSSIDTNTAPARLPGGGIAPGLLLRTGNFVRLHG